MATKSIQLSAKGLADFMTQGDAARRSTLRNFKLQTAEGAIKIKFYAEARSAIRNYHVNGNEVSVLEDAVARLQTKVAQTTRDRSRDRLRRNIRAIESYRKNFGTRQFTILGSPTIRLVSGSVTVSATPDLYVREDGQPKLVKFEFTSGAPDDRVLQIILVILSEAASVASLPIRPGDVMILDVERARVLKGRRTATRIKRDIQAACQTIEDLWPRIK